MVPLLHTMMTMNFSVEDFWRVYKQLKERNASYHTESLLGHLGWLSYWETKTPLDFQRAGRKLLEEAGGSIEGLRKSGEIESFFGLLGNTAAFYRKVFEGFALDATISPSPKDLRRLAALGRKKGVQFRFTFWMNAIKENRKSQGKSGSRLTQFNQCPWVLWYMSKGKGN
jgi:hypothetical protein